MFNFPSEMHSINWTIPFMLLYCSKVIQQTDSLNNNVVTCLKFSRCYSEGLSDTSSKMYSLEATVRQGCRNVKELL